MGDGSVNITHHGAAENNDDGSATQSYLIDGADLGWSGQVRFDVDDTLFLTAEASTGDKNVRVSVLTQTGDAVEEEVDAASPGWVARAEDARHRIALGALDLAEVGATHLRVEVVDGAGAVDARACGASQAWLVLNSPDGAKHKTKVCAPVLDGVAVLELGRLASSTSRASRSSARREVQLPDRLQELRKQGRADVAGHRTAAQGRRAGFRGRRRGGVPGAARRGRRPRPPDARQARVPPTSASSSGTRRGRASRASSSRASRRR